MRTLFLPAAALVLFGGPALAQDTAQASQSAYIGGEKSFEDMSQQERDAARKLARTRKPTLLRVCADPGNMPFSDMKAEGFENKIAETLAQSMGARVTYAWRPTFERGLTRQPMSDLNLCDVMVGIPTDYEALLTTTPLYRSTYVFAYRKDTNIHIKDLDDPILRTARVGVYETSGLRSALAKKGAKSNVQVLATSHDADLVPEHQPWHQVEQVVKGELDIAAVWGPFAGWAKEVQHAPIVLQPANLMDDTIPMEFSVAIGVRKYDAVMKYALEDAMEDKKKEIGDILKAYGVPLVQCSECLISGDIPAHGDYILQADEVQTTDRPPERTRTPKAQIEKSLASGTSVNDEMYNGTMAADIERVGYLLTKKGADANYKGYDGETPMHLAVTNSDLEMISLLLEHGARVDEADRDGYTPLALAAARNKTKAAKLLIAKGANLESTIPGGYTPLFIAAGEGKLAVAKALVDAGARCDIAEGPQHLTLLMAMASQKPPERRVVQLMQVVGPVELAQELIKHGANANAATTKGVTALMIAAAHDNSPLIGVLMQAGADATVKSEEGQTALEIAQQNGNDSATRTLQLLQRTSAAQPQVH